MRSSGASGNHPNDTRVIFTMIRDMEYCSELIPEAYTTRWYDPLPRGTEFAANVSKHRV